MLRARRRVFFSTALFLIASAALAQTPSSLAPGEKPADAPPQWKEWIGEYGPDNFIYSVRESQGRLWISSIRGGEWQVVDAPIEKYEQAMSANGVPLAAKFHRARSSRTRSSRSQDSSRHSLRYVARFSRNARLLPSPRFSSAPCGRSSA